MFLGPLEVSVGLQNLWFGRLQQPRHVPQPLEGVHHGGRVLLEQGQVVPVADKLPRRQLPAVFILQEPPVHNAQLLRGLHHNVHVLLREAGCLHVLLAGAVEAGSVEDPQEPPPAARDNIAHLPQRVDVPPVLSHVIEHVGSAINHG